VRGAQCLDKQRLAVAEIMSERARRHARRRGHSAKRRGAKAFLSDDIPACRYKPGAPLLMIYNPGHSAAF
jgi:hypothetical protein